MYELEATADVLLMTGPGQSAAAQQITSGAPEARKSEEAMLIRAVLEGDLEKYGRLYHLYAPLVHGVLLARIPRSEVEDLVQEIFLHALKKLSTLRDTGSFGPWIAMIARNRAMDFHRKSRETVEVTDDLRSSDSSGPKAAEILEIIRSLPDAYRETLVLR